MVPMVDGDAETIGYFSQGIPCKLARTRAAASHAACGGDAFDFISNPKWNNFPKPKIAFKSGWAGPGTQMEDNDYHGLVTKFSQIIDTVDRGMDVPIEGTDETSKVEPTEVLNLQFFHRPDTRTHPQMPPLAQLLEWPSYLTEGAECDNATRVSQRGAVTWWHLDDCGEFVMQTALPLKSPGSFLAKADASRFPRLVTSRTPTKLFIYGPRDSYDWFMHDDEAGVSGKIAALNLFNTPDEFLPEAEHLPILCIAVLEDGSEPLVSPPNIPHIVITINDCVMVEQRRVCNFFLDEVSYLLQKVRYWSNNPVIYTYVNETLQHEGVVCGEIIPFLIQQFQISVRDESPFHQLLAGRIAASLYAIVHFPKHFQMPDSSRNSLKLTLQESPFREVLTPLLIQALERHWDVRRFWKRQGSLMSLVGRASEELPSDQEALAVVVYRDSCPIFGPCRNTMEQAKFDYAKMKDLDVAGLRKYLTSIKIRDDMLDDLF